MIGRLVPIGRPATSDAESRTETLVVGSLAAPASTRLTVRTTSTSIALRPWPSAPGAESHPSWVALARLESRVRRRVRAPLFAASRLGSRCDRVYMSNVASTPALPAARQRDLGGRRPMRPRSGVDGPPCRLRLSFFSRRLAHVRRGPAASATSHGVGVSGAPPEVRGQANAWPLPDHDYNNPATPAHRRSGRPPCPH